MEDSWPALGRRDSAAHAFSADANIGGPVVAVVAPARVVELDDVIAVVRADRFVEPQGADALPVPHLDVRQATDAGAVAEARHEDVEHHRPGRLRVARIE